MVLYYECPWDLQLKILNNVSIMLLNSREAAIFSIRWKEGKLSRVQVIRTQQMVERRWPGLDGWKCHLYGETLRAGRRPYNAIWSIWLYDGVCQIESSAVAFSRQIQGASSRKCAHPSHLWTTDVCVQNVKWYVRRQLPIGITVGIRIPERGMMEEEGWPRTPDRCRSFFTFLKYQVPSRRSCLTLGNRTFTAAWKPWQKAAVRLVL